MVIYIIALAAVLFFVGSTTALYYVLTGAISQRAFNPFIACAVLWSFIALVPDKIIWIAARFANYVYMTYPSLKIAAWDVGLALVFTIGLYLSYVIGLMIALGAAFTFFEKARQNKVTDDINE